jgi:L-ascorbate metabolism protein UlaG (beta-lactamase superfamily)
MVGDEMQLHGHALFDALSRPPQCPIQVWRLGGAGIVLHTQVGLLYIDPFLAEGGGPGWVRQSPPIIDRLPEPALIVATHEHEDHTDPMTLAAQSQFPACAFVGNAPSVAIAHKAGFALSQTRTIAVGERVQHGAFTITALPSVDPEIPAPMAILVEIQLPDRVWRLYHGGDTQMSDAFAEAGRVYDIDCCCLSVGAYVHEMQYYLTPQQSLEAAQMLGARTLIPVHWDLWVVNGVEASVWNTLTPLLGVNLVVLPPGSAWCANLGATTAD